MNLHVLKLADRKNLYKYMKGLISLGRIDEFKYSTVILVLLLHVFGPWETRMYNVCFSTESQVFIFIGWASPT